jgi:hypothetical protein
MNDGKLQGGRIGQAHFPEREKQDVFLAAPMDGFTAVRKMRLPNPASVHEKVHRS